MPVSLRLPALTSIGLAAVLLLAGCSKHPAAPPPATVPASTSTVSALRSQADAGPGRPPATSRSTTAAPGTTSSAAIAPQPLLVTAVVLGNTLNADRHVSRPNQVFAPDEKAIYASVATSGRTTKAMLATHWTWLHGDGLRFSSISEPIATDGPAITTFKVQNPDRWPEGKYEVVVTLDGKPVARRTFEIKKG